MIHNCINFSSLSSMIYQENMRHLLNWNGSKLKPILLDLLLSFSYTVYFRKFTGIILRSCRHSAGILVTGTQTYCWWGGQQLFFCVILVMKQIPWFLLLFPGMMSTTASLGLILLWDVDAGLTQIDKYLYSTEDYIKVHAQGFYIATITVAYSASSALCTILHSWASVGFPLLSHQFQKNFVLITAWRS